MKRERYLDILRVIAMFAVIFNHSWGYFSCDKYQLYAGTSIYYLDVVLNTLTRIDVPIFLMISGYLMLKSTKYSNINNCLKKSGGVLKLIAIWVILYTIGHVFLLRDIDIVTGLKSIAHGIKGGYYYYNHLWYLYVTICLYLLTPMLHWIIKDEKNINYILAIWLFYSVIIPGVSHYIKVLEPSAYFNMNYLGGYLGYYILGYKLGTMDTKTRGLRFGFLLTWIMTSNICILNMKCNNGDSYWQSFMSPGIILMSIFLFLSIKNQFVDNDIKSNLTNLIESIASISLGVYLLHYFVRDVFLNLYWEYVKIEWLYFVFEPLTVSIITISIVVVLSKFNFVKKYFFTI